MKRKREKNNFLFHELLGSVLVAGLFHNIDSNRRFCSNYLFSFLAVMQKRIAVCSGYRLQPLAHTHFLLNYFNQRAFKKTSYVCVVMWVQARRFADNLFL